MRVEIRAIDRPILVTSAGLVLSDEPFFILAGEDIGIYERAATYPLETTAPEPLNDQMLNIP